MKLNEITKVTKKNFDEVEKALCQYERQYNEERPAWRVGRAAGDIAFGILFIGAYAVLQTIFPSKVVLPFLGSAAAAVLGSFLIFLLAATVARIAHRDKLSATSMKGSDLERAEALLKRAKAVCNGIPKSLLSNIGLVLPIIFFLCVTIWIGFEMVGEHGITFDVIVLPLSFCILIAIATIPYKCYSGLCRMSYKTLNGEPGLLGVLEAYVRELQFAEERDLKTRLQAEEAEQNRLRGDKLYRQASSSRPVDEKLMVEAADLGSRPACLYMGQKIMRAWTAGRKARIYTQDEMEKMAKAGRDYFLTAGLAEDYPEPLQREVQLGGLVFSAVTEHVDHSILRSLRELRSSGKLSKEQEYICDDAIRTAVDELDHRAEQAALQEEARKAVLRPSLESVIARMEAASGSSSSSWDTMNDDLDIIFNRSMLDDDSWRDAE